MKYFQRRSLVVWNVRSFAPPTRSFILFHGPQLSKQQRNSAGPPLLPLHLPTRHPIPPNFLTPILSQSIRGFAKKGKSKRAPAAKVPKVAEEGDMPEGTDLEAMAEKMERFIKALERELKTLRAGRADPGIFDHLEVDAYGASTPLSSVADVTVKGPQLCVVNVYDPGLVSAVDTAIRECGMGLNPIVNENSSINVPIPKTSKEKREKLVKLAKQQSEKTKQSIRNARRTAIDETRKAELPEDDSKRLVKQVDDIADSMLKKVTSTLESKQKDILNTQ